MFPCVNPSQCGEMWHALASSPPCTAGDGPVRALGDVQAIRTAWARGDLLGEGFNHDPLAIAKIRHERLGLSAVARLTVRSMDDIYDVTVTHTHASAFVQMASSRAKGQVSVHHASFRQGTEWASSDPSSWSGAGWLPDVMEVEGTEGTFRATAMLKPSACGSNVDAIAALNNGTFWIAEVVDGYERGLNAEAHAALSSLRKAHIGALLANLEQELVAAAFASEGDLCSQQVSTLAVQLQHVGNDFGLVAGHDEGLRV